MDPSDSSPPELDDTTPAWADEPEVDDALAQRTPVGGPPLCCPPHRIKSALGMP